MSMKYFAKFLHEQLTEITSQSFLDWNWSEKVIYPYITYNFESEPDGEIRDIFDITLNLFDQGKSYINLLGLESEIQNKLDRKRFIKEESIIYIRKGRSYSVPTGDDNIKRREIKLTIKIDWLDKGAI